MHRLVQNRLVNLHVRHTRTMEPKPPTTFCCPVCSSSSCDRYWAHRPDGEARQTDLTIVRGIPRCFVLPSDSREEASQ